MALYFDAAETIVYHSKRQRVRAPYFIVPGRMTTDYHFHPEMNAAIEDLILRVVGPDLPRPAPPTRLYLSRSRHQGWHAIANEAEVEAAMTDAGFAIIHPQELPLRAQLAIYASAECIVSLYSSAVHNSLFAPRGCGVFCLNWLNHCQAGISALRGQPTAFMAPTDVGFLDPALPRAQREFSFRMDCADLVRQVRAFLAFAGRAAP